MANQEIEKRLCICGPEYTDRGLTSPYCMVHEFAADVLYLISKNIQVEVECPECEGQGERIQQPEIPLTLYIIRRCNKCKGSGKALRKATHKELEEGGILILNKEKR